MPISLRNVNTQNKRIDMLVENGQSFILGYYKILKLIDMWQDPLLYLKKRHLMKCLFLYFVLSYILILKRINGFSSLSCKILTID